MDPERPHAPLLSDPPPPDGPPSWRTRAYRVVFLADTPAGKRFDLALIAVILLSVVVVMLESVSSFRAEHGVLLRRIEWGLTLLFTAEYLLRLAIVAHPMRYARSFFGVVDLLAVLPFYLSLLVPGAQFLLVIRLLRILRIFRVLKLVRYLDEASTLTAALAASRRKIAVFVFTVLTLVTILGSLMYLVEGGQNGFTSIPMSIYWAVVTLTTVGYGDISPATPMGKLLATVIMILGYGIIAVPTGIVTVEIANATRPAAALRCPQHPDVRHDADARFCRLCGKHLAETPDQSSESAASASRSTASVVSPATS
ncbi:MAG: ion transporter [Rhodothermales bacterium]|nr:ion transporter [Rhodothermales bacterium]MCA0270407.1 ion transporter [Bacteroidota bacterium]